MTLNADLQNKTKFDWLGQNVEPIKFLCNIKFSAFDVIMKEVYCIGGFHSILKHREMLGGQLHAYSRFMPCRSEQIWLNCVYFQPNIRSIARMNWIQNPATAQFNEISAQYLLIKSLDC